MLRACSLLLTLSLCPSGGIISARAFHAGWCGVPGFHQAPEPSWIHLQQLKPPLAALHDGKEGQTMFTDEHAFDFLVSVFNLYFNSLAILQLAGALFPLLFFVGLTQSRSNSEDSSRRCLLPVFNHIYGHMNCMDLLASRVPPSLWWFMHTGLLLAVPDLLLCFISYISIISFVYLLIRIFRSYFGRLVIFALTCEFVISGRLRMHSEASLLVQPTKKKWNELIG